MKRFLTFILIILMILSLASCANPDNNYNGNSSDDDDVKDNNDNDADDEDDDNNSNQSQETEGKYSTLLQNVLNNPEYNQLINYAKANSDKVLVRSEKFDPHPHTFLKKQGHDVQAIKDGKNECYTISYVLDEEPNYLYIATRVDENEISTNYLLKYKLTDKEMKDYSMVQSYPYAQAAFINDELSRIKTPESVQTIKTSSEQQDINENDYNRYHKDLNNADSCKLIYTNVNNENNTVDAIIIPTIYDNYSLTHKSEIMNINILLGRSIKNENGIYRIIGESRVESTEEKPGTFYCGQEFDFVHSNYNLASK